MSESKLSTSLGLIAMLVVGALLGAGGLALYQTYRPPSRAYARGEAYPPAVPLGSVAPSIAPDRSWWDIDAFESGEDREWNPFEEIRRMESEMDRLFDSAWSRASRLEPRILGPADPMFDPDLDLRDEGDHFIVEMDLPGADKSDIRIDVEGQVLKISGTRESRTEEKQGVLLRNERRTGSFSRSIPLPAPVDADRVEATQTEGVLRITLPKASMPPSDHPIEIK